MASESAAVFEDLTRRGEPRGVKGVATVVLASAIS